MGSRDIATRDYSSRRWEIVYAVAQGPRRLAALQALLQPKGELRVPARAEEYLRGGGGEGGRSDWRSRHLDHTLGLKINPSVRKETLTSWIEIRLSERKPLHPEQSSPRQKGQPLHTSLSRALRARSGGGALRWLQAAVHHIVYSI